MTIEVEGKRYKICWNYLVRDKSWDKVWATADDEHRIITECAILLWEGDNWNIISIVRIIPYYKDKFDKNKARKISLAKAINELGSSLPKKEHTEIWNAYVKMRNGKW